MPHARERRAPRGTSTVKIRREGGEAGRGPRARALMRIWFPVWLITPPLEPSPFPVGGERTYLTWGTQYLPSARVGFSPFRMHLIFHPPLYPYFIAGLQSLPGGLAVVQWVQVALSALLVPAVGRVGAHAFG